MDVLFVLIALCLHVVIGNSHDEGTNGVTVIRKIMTKEPGTKDNPGLSCKLLKQNHPELKSGIYWIKLPAATKVYCDMDTSEGGWTMVGKVTVATEAEATEVYFKNLESSDISRLPEVTTTNRFLLSSSGMVTLQAKINFTSIRWYCHKPWHGRTLDIHSSNNTLGKSVVDFFLLRIGYYQRPVSCGSFTRGENDTSVIGQHCEQWFAQKWLYQRLYDPMGIFYKHWFSLGDNRKYVNCDDQGDEPTDPNYSPIGEWMVYVK